MPWTDDGTGTKACWAISKRARRLGRVSTARRGDSFQSGPKETLNGRVGKRNTARRFLALGDYVNKNRFPVARRAGPGMSGGHRTAR